MEIVKTNLMLDPKVSADALYQGVKYMQELALYHERADETYAAEIQSILTRLIADVEDNIQHTAMLRGLRFNPRYINDVIPETHESFPQCTRGACR